MTRKLNRKLRCVFLVIVLVALFITAHRLMQLYYGLPKEFSFDVQLEGFSPVTVHYNELIPPKQWHTTVVLLHVPAMRTTWEKAGTPDILLKAGYRVISLTFPTITLGSSATSITYPIKGAILMETLKTLKSTNSVLVVPSLTGSFGLPVVLRSGFPLKGFVAVAPADTDLFTPKEYKILKIPSFVVYGTDDLDMQYLTQLKLIPNVELVGLAHAGHICYMDQPDQFHEDLLHFLHKID